MFHLPGASLRKGDGHIYQIGDHLVHPYHGGCTIQKVLQREYGDKMVAHFVLSPECEPELTLTIPAENIDRVGLRGIISKQEADRLLHYLTSPGEPAQWDNDYKRRQKTYEGVLKASVPFDLAKMIRELLMQEATEPLGRFDKILLPRAEKRLFSEMALARGQRYQDVLRLVNDAFHF